MSGYDDVAEAYDAHRAPDEDATFIESMAVFSEFARALRPGGRLLVITRVGEWLFVRGRLRA